MAWLTAEAEDDGGSREKKKGHRRNSEAFLVDGSGTVEKLTLAMGTLGAGTATSSAVLLRLRSYSVVYEYGLRCTSIAGRVPPLAHALASAEP